MRLERRHIVAVITAATGDRVVVTEEELIHGLRHFTLPRDIFLELLERILKDPSDVFADDVNSPRFYKMFYRLEDGRYLVAIVKMTDAGAFLASVYPTGKAIRSKHKRMKRVEL